MKSILEDVYKRQALEAADKILFMPDALSYMLTGKMVTEYTIASTSQMLNPRTKRFEKEPVSYTHLKMNIIQHLVQLLVSMLFGNRVNGKLPRCV